MGTFEQTQDEFRDITLANHYVRGWLIENGFSPLEPISIEVATEILRAWCRTMGIKP